MPMMREHFHYISGSVNSTPGTFAHDLGRKPWMVIPVVIAAAATTQTIGGTVVPGTIAAPPAIVYDEASSDASNVVLVGESSTYRTFVALLIGQRPAE